MPFHLRSVWFLLFASCASTWSSAFVSTIQEGRLLATGVYQTSPSTVKNTRNTLERVESDSPTATDRAQNIAVHPGKSFLERVRQLQEFKQAHNGSTIVPKRFKENPALGNWVNKQRQQYRRYNSGTKPCSLTKERIEILDQLGFCWDASAKHTANMIDVKDREEEWWRNYQEVQKLIDGRDPSDAPIRLVPRTSPSGRWLQQQRQAYERQNEVEAKKSPVESTGGAVVVCCTEEVLSSKQLEALFTLDPDWWMSHRQWQWEIRFRELQEYATKHGTTVVPISDPNRQLAHFVSNQRKQYNLKRQGKISNLTEERIDRLNAIDFVWNRWEHEFSKKQEAWVNNKA